MTRAKQETPTRARRFRRLFPFQLDVNKPEEQELAETIDDLKARRAFSKTVRDGIRLICDLRAGRLDVLFELFPWIQAQMGQASAPQPAAPQPQHNQALVEQISRLERLLVQQGNVPIEGGRLAKIQREPEPPAEDLIEVREAKSNHQINSGWNMIIAATLQNLGHCNALSAEIRAYGVATNRIPRDALSKKNWRIAESTPFSARPESKPQSADPPKGPKRIELPKNLMRRSIDEDDDDDLALFDDL